MFQGSSPRRCRINFVRNVLAHARAETERVVAVVRAIFDLPSLASQGRQWDEVCDNLAGRYRDTVR
ncbi:transposase [Serinicoccus sp. CNJ-927]|uniref:transposase n=1 Tax=Serinicoccus sp. CNJ-927 TaxID=1904970 RepID=UPI00096A679C